MNAPIDLDQHLPAIVAGDARAFGAFLSHAEPTLRRSLASFAAQLDTESVLQETMLRLWQVAPRTESDGRPNGLLRLGLRIAKNLAIDELRRRRERPVAEIPEAEPSPREPDIASDPFLRAHIEQCLAALPDRPREALLSRLLEGGNESEATLAERLGMTLNTFFQNVARARKWLLGCLSERGVHLDARAAEVER